MDAVERLRFLQAPSETAPDPVSQFKVRALQVFPQRIRNLALDTADVMITRGLYPSALRTTVTVPIKKPEGGERPVGLMPELGKRTEGVVASRFNSALSQSPPGRLLTGVNRAYVRGWTIGEIHAIIRITMEADVLFLLAIKWLHGDYHKWFDIIRREFLDAKLEAIGVPHAVGVMITHLYTSQICRIATAYGLSGVRPGASYRRIQLGPC